MLPESSKGLTNLGPKFHPPKPRPFWGFLFDTQTEGLGGYFPTCKGFDGDRHSHVWGWNVAIDPETLTTVHIFFQMRTDSLGEHVSHEKKNGYYFPLNPDP